MLTMIHMEMLFVPPIHQPIVAPSSRPSGWCNQGLPSPGSQPVAASWRRSGRFPC